MVGGSWTFWDGGVVVGLDAGGFWFWTVGGGEEDVGPVPAGAAQVGELTGGCAGWGDVAECGSHGRLGFRGFLGRKVASW